MARHSFHTIAARGLEHLAAMPPDRPVLLFCTHTNWWDGLIGYFISKHLPGKAIHCMMEERQLRQFQFFTWLGGFSVDLDSPEKALPTLRYVRKLLKSPTNAVWIFPQGKLSRPNEPFVAQPGTDYFARSTPEAMLVPIALRYDFFRDDRPNVLIEIGPPFPGTELVEGRISAECSKAFARVSAAAEEQSLDGFTPLFPPVWPINKRWEWIKRAVTGRLSGFKLEN